MSAAKSVDCDRSWHNASFCLSQGRLEVHGWGFELRTLEVFTGHQVTGHKVTGCP